jgi:hypothetical protein
MILHSRLDVVRTDALTGEAVKTSYRYKTFPVDMFSVCMPKSKARMFHLIPGRESISASQISLFQEVDSCFINSQVFRWFINTGPRLDVRQKVRI